MGDLFEGVPTTEAARKFAVERFPNMPVATQVYLAVAFTCGYISALANSRDALGKFADAELAEVEAQSHA